jgi:energy-coupling factor transporter ATP-binding protein EcfA2
MIRLDNISKQNGHQILFIDASMGLQKGEKAGLVGPNGAGKTTLFRMISGQEAPDDGQVTIDAGMTIGYFSQDVGDMSGMSAVAAVMDGVGPVSALAVEIAQLEAAMADPDQADKMDALVERYGGRKPMPVRAVRGSQVKEAARPRDDIGKAARIGEHGSDRIRNDGGRGGRAMLIGDDAQFFAFPRQPHDGAKKIGAVRRINPRRPGDQMRTARLLDRPFAGELAGAIDRERRGRVRFLPGCGPTAVEDIVGREMKEGHACIGGPACHGARSGFVHEKRRLAVAFCLVDGVLGCGIDDHVGRQLIQSSADLVRPRQVDQLAIGCDHGAESRKTGDQCRSHLTLHASDQYSQ